MHQIRRKLVAELLGKCSIGKNDLVLEIGPGKGIIPEGIVNQVQQVLTVESDTQGVKYH